jgi:hypothetical protein
VTVIFPEATKSLGNTMLIAVATISNMSAPDLSSEINASTSVIGSCYLYADMVATGETNKGTAPTRSCEKTEREEFGRTKYSISDIQYVYDPQAAATTDENLFKAALAPDTELYLVERVGLDSRTTALAAGQKVNVHHVRVGPQNRTKTGDGEFDEFSITQAVSYIEDPVYDVAIVA